MKRDSTTATIRHLAALADTDFDHETELAFLAIATDDFDDLTAVELRAGATALEDLESAIDDDDTDAEMVIRELMERVEAEIEARDVEYWDARPVRP